MEHEDLNYVKDNKQYNVKFSASGDNNSAMDKGHFIMMVVTKSSVKSAGCIKDLDRADELGCPIIALLEEGTKFTKKVSKDRFNIVIPFTKEQGISYAYEQGEKYIEELTNGR